MLDLCDRLRCARTASSSEPARQCMHHNMRARSPSHSHANLSADTIIQTHSVTDSSSQYSVS